MILDIGCGNGNGIIELLKNNNIDNIITIEENEFCIECAYSNIKAKGINVKKIIRNEATFFRGQYINRYSEINDFDISRVTIIQGDILHDEKIKEYIKKQKFDAVTCWLLGTHQSNNDNIDYIEDFIKAGTMDNETFRLLVQNCIYELSDVFLNKDAFLHIVDRVGLPCSEERMKICLNNHKGQASVTSLIVDEEIKFLEYEPIGNGIRMKNLLIDDEENATKGMAFISVLSKK
jgi:SAM-dependent methyltransferase